MLTKSNPLSYFIECLPCNVPGGLLKPKLDPIHRAIVDCLKATTLNDVECQNGSVDLFGSSKEQWSGKKARTFVNGPQRLEVEA